MTAPRGEPCTRSLRLAGRVVAAWLACVTVLVFGAREAYAHQASDGYLTLTFSAEATSVDGRWDLPVSNLERVLVLDRDSDGAVRMDRVPARREDIVALAFSHLAIRSGGAPCPLSPDDLAPTNHQGAPYVRLQFTAVCPAAPRVIDLDYTLFFDVDPSHRGLVRIEDGAASRSILFSSGFRHERFTRSLPDRPKELASAIRSGVAHIASGIDHLLFLLALLLPSVLRREDGGWKPVAAFRTALVEVAKIVTAFTLAHSITLSLSALDVVRLPARFIEPAIAASVVVAALQNVVRPVGHGRWRVAFTLGLLHGFGFSAALIDLGLRRSDLVTTLLGFNVGVELGQLAVVAVFLPLAYALRTSPYYRKVGLVGGSVVIAVVASVWFVQRAFPREAPLGRAACHGQSMFTVPSALFATQTYLPSYTMP